MNARKLRFKLAGKALATGSVAVMMASGANGEIKGVAERSEALSWFIQAHVPCDRDADMIGILRSELTLFSATAQETERALSLVEASADSCGALRDMSRQLLSLNGDDPSEFVSTLDLPLDTTTAETLLADADAGDAVRPEDFARVRAEDRAVPPPPRSAGRD